MYFTMVEVVQARKSAEAMNWDCERPEADRKEASSPWGWLRLFQDKRKPEER